MSIFSKIFKKKEEIPTEEKYYSFLVHESVEDKKNIYGFNQKYLNQEETLYKMFGNCDIMNKHIKLIIITDTHNCLKEDEFKEFVNNHRDYDLCLLLGDHNTNDVPIILKYIDKDKIYALLGNHDYDYIKEYGLNDLNGQIVEKNGVKLLGIQGSYKYKPADFPSFTQKESIEFLNCRDKVDILVSHDNRFDNSMLKSPAHQGLFGITYYLFKNKVSYHIHGHIHNPYHKTLLNGTQEISSYMYEYFEV